MQWRDAVLKEVTSAVKLLIQFRQFSTSSAMAIASHIKQHVTDAKALDQLKQDVYMDYAMLLDLQPLQELLGFLWFQLGVRAQLLQPYIKAQSLLGVAVSHALKSTPPDALHLELSFHCSCNSAQDRAHVHLGCSLS